MIRGPDQTRDHMSCDRKTTHAIVLPSICNWYLNLTRTKNKVTSLELSHGHHRRALAASARAARGRCFDPKRLATVPRCRACSVSREHRVGSRINLGQNQTQANSNSSRSIYKLSARAHRQLLKMAHTRYIVPPGCRIKSFCLRAVRMWACAASVCSCLLYILKFVGCPRNHVPGTYTVML